ncbi:MAG TPA: haloacid dehalogenase-like hydrolase [Terriglobales bacterium]|jgi:phosphoserine phosphatase
MSDPASAFIESVLALRPEIAVFDCDGTLWSGDSGRDFFYWEIERGLVTREVADAMLARYRLYEAGEVGEEPMCAEMVTMHHGLAIDDLHRAAEEFFIEVVNPRIFPEMLELTHRLAEQGCDLWAVSSTNNWVVEAGASRFRIARNHVLAAAVHIENGRATDRLHRVPTGAHKAAAIREVIGKPVHGVFGNSVHDHAMLEIAKHPFCINPNPDLEHAAKQKRWPIYWPKGTRK